MFNLMVTQILPATYAINIFPQETTSTPKHTGNLKNLNVHSAVHRFSQGVLSGSTGLESMKEKGFSVLTVKKMSESQTKAGNQKRLGNLKIQNLNSKFKI